MWLVALQEMNTHTHICIHRDHRPYPKGVYNCEKKKKSVNKGTA